MVGDEFIVVEDVVCGCDVEVLGFCKYFVEDAGSGSVESEDEDGCEGDVL